MHLAGVLLSTVLVAASVLVPVLRGAETMPAPTPGRSLWYDKPSEKWTDALPLGNGRMGAMIFGGIDRERLALNEDTLYSGEPPADLRTIDIRKDFDHVTGLLRNGKNSEADTYISKNWLGRNQQCYQPLGDLLLDFSGAAASGDAQDYRRWLDLANATAGVSYRRGGVTPTPESRLRFLGSRFSPGAPAHMPGPRR